MIRSLLFAIVMIAASSVHAQEDSFLLAHAIIHTQKKPLPLTLEVAHTPEQRKFGLMNRRHIGQFQGMLFLFPKPHDYEFWMGNTYIPLDMIFINDRNEIVYIASDVPPLTTQSRSAKQLVNAVIELSGGTAEAIGIHVGDRIEYTLSQPIDIE